MAAVVRQHAGDNGINVINIGGVSHPCIIVGSIAAIGGHTHRIAHLVRAESARAGRHGNVGRQLGGFFDEEVNRILVLEQVGDDYSVFTVCKILEGVSFRGRNLSAAVNGEPVAGAARFTTLYTDDDFTVHVFTCGFSVTGDGEGVGSFRNQRFIDPQCATHKDGVVVAGDFIRTTQHLAVHHVGDDAFIHFGHTARNGGNHLVAVRQHYGVEAADLLGQ